MSSKIHIIGLEALIIDINPARSVGGKQCTYKTICDNNPVSAVMWNEKLVFFHLQRHNHISQDAHDFNAAECSENTLLHPL